MKNWQVCEIVDYRIEFGIAQLAGEILDTTSTYNIGERITKNRVMVKQLDKRSGAWLDFGYDDPWHPDEYYFVADNFNIDGDHIETDFLLKACLIPTKRVGTQFGIPILTIDA